MIKGYKNKLTETILFGRYPKKGFPVNLCRKALILLNAMNAAVVLGDLRFPPGNMLEPLKGDRKGQHSLRINKQWRICFVWTPEGPDKVEIVDYH